MKRIEKDWITPQDSEWEVLERVYVEAWGKLYNPHAANLWGRRGDVSAYQWFGNNADPKMPEDISAAIITAQAEETKVVEMARKICVEEGVELLPPNARQTYEHYTPRANFQPQEVEPGYAWLEFHPKRGWTLLISKWGESVAGVLKKSLVRTDNGPGVSHGTTEFRFHGREEWTTLNAFTSGAGGEKRWSFRINEGETPSPKYPGKAYSGTGPHPCGRGNSSSSDEREVSIQTRVMSTRRVTKVTLWRIVQNSSGTAVSEGFLTQQMAEEEARNSYYKNLYGDVSVSTRLPWEIAPTVWQPVLSAKTVDELANAILSFPGEFGTRAYSTLKTTKFKFEFGVNCGEHDSPIPTPYVVRNNPKALSAGFGSLFVWEAHPDVLLEYVTNKGRAFKVKK